MHNDHDHGFEHVMFVAVISLLAIGTIMVSSASISIAERYGVSITHFASSQLFYVVLGILTMFIVSCIPINLLYKCSWLIFTVAVLLLIIVLVPGIAKTVNGSSRWISLGPINIQASEIMKFASIIYLAGYLYRREENLKTSVAAFLIPIFILGITSCLLLLEPDFGATVVIIAIFMGMLFVSGVPWSRFLALLPILLITLSSLVYFSPYRMKRLLSFMEPWENQFDSGYQLVQSLIAFGRGGVWGSGLGGSIQKLFYLPEPHTDFIFAVLSEELGLIGATLVIVLFSILFYRIFLLSKKAMAYDDRFSAFIAMGIFIWLVSQTVINIAVSIGALPTKGLSLPFISFGGSNLLINSAAIGVLLRINFELEKNN